jgi:hypothetical protein
VQTRLDERVIEYRVLFAAGDKGEAGQIGEDGPRAILPVEPEQDTRLWDLVRREVARDRRECLAQFRSVASVASVAKTAEPLVAMGLRDNCARSDYLPALAPGVASSTHLVQATLWCRQGFCLWQRTLTGRLTRAIDIKDLPLTSRSIHQTPGLLLVRERATEQIIKKERA